METVGGASSAILEWARFVGRGDDQMGNVGGISERLWA